VFNNLTSQIEPNTTDSGSPFKPYKIENTPPHNIRDGCQHSAEATKSSALQKSVIELSTANRKRPERSRSNSPHPRSQASVASDNLHLDDNNSQKTTHHELAEESERIKTATVARMTGYSVRQIQGLAAKGKIPSAAKLGSMWTFDPVRIRKWINEKEKETECLRQTYSNVKVSGIRAFKYKDEISDEAYEQALR
tara:strand:- start:1468 stop:2052 length:585 start_codon:yes stop_codon:yes gene_type:complete